MRSGQILILVLLVVVVILAVGLSVASRNITNLRTSTQTEQSQRAFTAAEGGVEDVLSRISAIETSNPQILTENGADIEVPIGDIKANVNVKASSVYERSINLGEVGQISLEGFGGSQAKVEWAKKGDLLEDTAEGPASAEITQLFGTSPVLQTRWYVQGDPGNTFRNENIGPNLGGLSTCVSDNFVHCVVLDLSAGPKVLRVKPFWVRTTARVSGVGVDLPTQTYNVSSVASTEIGVTRKVEVSRTALPQLPSVFDYALYSEGDILK